MEPNHTATIFLLLFFPFFVVGQNSENAGLSKKISVGILFSPDYSYRHLNSSEEDLDGFISFRDKNEFARLGFTTGIVVHSQISNRLALESGVRFSDKGEKYEIDFNDFETFDENPAENDPLIPKKHTVRYHYYYWGIPVKINYYFLQRNVRCFVSAGVASDFFLYGKSTAVSKFEDRIEESAYKIDADFNKVNFVGLAGLGMETRISDHIQLQAGPFFRYSFTPVFNSTLEGHLYSLGINIVLLSRL
ncbi:outer membrane beta-barrel protein [Maribellus maritimus]|uniref:outer membrane beta-barrel protein n=1 Tax=Maribellus maritimus TaxID=2870838 RepID=UPI001EE9FB46|nr:outer membrane beta-barrel protein [Maribellus maritimus]MCG6185985.1 outer membrane beta-barrel protein [Maribellus maritimus]